MVEKKKDANKAKVAREISKIWGGLESDQIATLKEHVEITKYKKGEMIYQCDETPTDAMCLLTGKVKIFKDGINGKSQIIRVIKPNEFFGFRAYFANEIYKTAAQALDTCTVVHFPLPVLMKLLQKSYKIGYYFIKYLSVEIGNQTTAQSTSPKSTSVPASPKHSCFCMIHTDWLKTESHWTAA